jgi:hypothetical protein
VNVWLSAGIMASSPAAVCSVMMMQVDSPGNPPMKTLWRKTPHQGRLHD